MIYNCSYTVVLCGRYESISIQRNDSKALNDRVYCIEFSIDFMQQLGQGTSLVRKHKY